MIITKTIIHFNNSTFTFRRTLFDGILKVFHNGTFIGELNTSGDGTFQIKKDEIFKLYNGYGVVDDLLYCDKIPFKFVLAYHDEEMLETTRKKFISEGCKKKKTFPFATKYFLSLHQFNSNNINQGSLFD